MERLTGKTKYDELYMTGCKTNCPHKNGYCDSECPEWWKVMGKLCDYEEAEEKGLLVKLPCKIGDTIWDNDFGIPQSYKVTGIAFGNPNKKNGEEQIVIHFTNSNRSIAGKVPACEFGKTVFLTKAEARQYFLEKIKEDRNEADRC